MTSFETGVAARLAAMEALQIAAIGLLFAMTGNDPKLEKMRAILQELQRQQDDGWSHLPEAVQAEAKAVLSALCRQVAEAAVGYRGTAQRPN